MTLIPELRRELRATAERERRRRRRRRLLGLAPVLRRRRDDGRARGRRRHRVRRAGHRPARVPPRRSGHGHRHRAARERAPARACASTIPRAARRGGCSSRPPPAASAACCPAASPAQGSARSARTAPSATTGACTPTRATSHATTARCSTTVAGCSSAPRSTACRPTPPPSRPAAPACRSRARTAPSGRCSSACSARRRERHLPCAGRRADGPHDGPGGRVPDRAAGRPGRVRQRATPGSTRPTGGSSSIRFRDGRTCTETVLRSETAEQDCPLPGFKPLRPEPLTQEQLSAKVTATARQGRRFWNLTVRFRAPVAIRDATSAYNAKLIPPGRTGKSHTGYTRRNIAAGEAGQLPLHPPQRRRHLQAPRRPQPGVDDRSRPTRPARTR